MEPTLLASLRSAVITRRDMLKLGLVAAVSPRRLLLGDDAWSFVVFSDTHFGIPGHLEKNRALLEEIAALDPDFAINIGDLTERAWTEEFEEATRGFAGLPYRVHSAPGNHDVRWAPAGPLGFQRHVGPVRQLFTHRGCAFLLLDSTVPLSHWGHIGGPQRRWITEELERIGRETPIFVFLHHPVGRGSGVDDDEALAETLAPFNVRVVFTGHGHSDLLWDWNGAAATMGKGLYQGSYQHARVDTLARELHLSRRTAEAPNLTRFLTVPLAPAAAHAHGHEHANAHAYEPGPLPYAWRHPLGGGVMSRLLLDGGTLFVSAMDGTLNAIRADDGAPIWRAATGGYCHSSPVLGGESVIVGSADGSVYAFDRATGAERWRVRTDGPVYASAAAAQGTAAIASGDGVVYGIDVASGALRWSWRLPPGPSAFAQSPAATDGERFFIGAWDQHVYALDVATGRELWRYRASDRGFYYSAAIGAPAVAGGRLYVPSNDNTLHAIDTATGTAVWTRKSAGDKFGYSSPTLVDGRIYIGGLGKNGEVRCLEAATGDEVWVTATGAEIYESSPALAGGILAIGSVNGTLWLIRAADGTILGSHRFPPGHFTSTPAAAPGRVYAATFAEEVRAFDVSTLTANVGGPST